MPEVTFRTDKPRCRNAADLTSVRLRRVAVTLRPILFVRPSGEEFAHAPKDDLIVIIIVFNHRSISFTSVRETVTATSGGSRLTTATSSIRNYKRLYLREYCTGNGIVGYIMYGTWATF